MATAIAASLTAGADETAKEAVSSLHSCRPAWARRKGGRGARGAGGERVWTVEGAAQGGARSGGAEAEGEEGGGVERGAGEVRTLRPRPRGTPTRAYAWAWHMGCRHGSQRPTIIHYSNKVRAGYRPAGAIMASRELLPVALFKGEKTSLSHPRSSANPPELPAFCLNIPRESSRIPLNALESLGTAATQIASSQLVASPTPIRLTRMEASMA